MSTSPAALSKLYKPPRLPKPDAVAASKEKKAGCVEVCEWTAQRVTLWCSCVCYSTINCKLASDNVKHQGHRQRCGSRITRQEQHGACRRVVRLNTVRECIGWQCSMDGQHARRRVERGWPVGSHVTGSACDIFQVSMLCVGGLSIQRHW